MERCILMKRSLLAMGHLPLSSTAHRSPPTGSSPSLSTRSLAKVLAMASSEDFSLQWQPAFRLEQAELMEDAPSLLKTCGDFDWKAQASELRALAHLSVRNISQSPNSTLKDVDESKSKDNGDTWFAVGLALATAALVQVSFHFNALAAEESVQTPEAGEAASRAPAWLTPVLLAFPVVSYVVFYVYRSQVNPSAKVTDWMFGVAATVIIANLVLISTLGVRLY
ncbi:hypothetical protein GOP47_0014343 [Adiantum capillus-veneris]|uniref:Uncharacterized protein n=1 Tax=Adiantum capillus-veneris TaxID=13818 RepID=A0A9D4ZE27_ADICA|nr:hypothetical protein GOP47_0014343 [Adiantum capillus-veneris]